MNDIAERAGVSRATVSYVLNGRHQNRLGQETRDRVLAAAAEMGYRSNELARAVATGKSRTLGILTSEELSEPQARTIGGALAEATKQGYSTKLIHVPFDADEEEAKRALQLCTSWRLDGALVIGLSDPHVELLHAEMSQGNRPVAFVGATPPENSTGAYGDDAAAWRLAVQYLVDLGHRRIAHLGARPDSKLSQNRSALCLQVLREFGLPVTQHSTIFTSWVEANLIAEGTHRLLDAPQRPTALLCSGDALAMVALCEARSRGLNVPRDLSVIGFSNFNTSPYTDPPLTSIAEPIEETARHAVRHLLARIEGEPGGANDPNVPFKVTTGFRVVVRSSTAPPKQKM